MFAEFGTTSNFSFLRGASHPEELVGMASGFGLAGVGIADRNSLAGVVRAYVFARDQCKGKPIRVVAGARLVFADGTPDILVYPTDLAAYGRLTRLLTLGNRRAEKGSCILYLGDLLDWIEGLQLVVMERSSATEEDVAVHPTPPVGEEGRKGQAVVREAQTVPDASPSPARAGEGGLAQRGRMRVGAASELALIRHSFAATLSPVRMGERTCLATLRFTSPSLPANDNQRTERDSVALLRRLHAAAPNRVWIAVSMLYGPHMRATLANRVRLARETNLPLLATNDVLMHAPERRPLADVLFCIRNGTTLDEAGRRLEANAERHLKSGEEMTRILSEAPEAVPETLRFLDGISFSLSELRYNYPDELRGEFNSEQEALKAYSEAGARWRYPEGVPDAVQRQLAHELALVAKLDYAAYFLTVHDIVRFARVAEHPVPGPRLGRQFGAVLLPRHHRGRSRPSHDLLFERFISEPAQRAARHRRRLRARAARGP